MCSLHTTASTLDDDGNYTIMAANPQVKKGIYRSCFSSVCSWPLNNTGLDGTGPLICVFGGGGGFLFVVSNCSKCIFSYDFLITSSFLWLTVFKNTVHNTDNTQNTCIWKIDCVIIEASSQQEAISLGESEVIWKFQMREGVSCLELTDIYLNRGTVWFETIFPISTASPFEVEKFFFFSVSIYLFHQEFFDMSNSGADVPSFHTTKGLICTPMI